MTADTAVRRVIRALDLADSDDIQPLLGAIELWKKGVYPNDLTVPRVSAPEPTDLTAALARVLRRYRVGRAHFDPAPLDEFREILLQRLRIIVRPDAARNWTPDASDLERAGRKADAFLNGVKDAAADPEPRTPWSGTDAWEELQAVPRRLLEFTHDREEIAIDDELSKYVWGETDCANVSLSAITGALHRANQFLQGQGDRRALSKVRGRRLLRWQ
jgi:hypothetical protein